MSNPRNGGRTTVRPEERGGPLPDFTGIDLTALARQIDHPVLAAVLEGLIDRVGAPDGSVVAYFEDSPNGKTR